MRKIIAEYRLTYARNMFKILIRYGGNKLVAFLENSGKQLILPKLKPQRNSTLLRSTSGHEK